MLKTANNKHRVDETKRSLPLMKWAFHESRMETTTNELDTKQIDTAYRLTEIVYNEKCILKYTQLSHNTVTTN